MASENIRFTQIPDGIRDPGIYNEFNTTNARKSLPATVPEMCVVGQKLTTGTLAVNTPQKIISEDEAILYAGAGSPVHLAVQAAYVSNPSIDLSICVVDDSGSDATGTITYANNAGSNGTISLYIANRKIDVGVVKGDTPTDIATNTVTAISNDVNNLPVTAVSALGVVTLTAKFGGELGNEIPVAYDSTVLTTTVTVVQMSGGATAPSLSTALDAIEPANYDFIIFLQNSDSEVGLLKTHIETVSAPLEGRRRKAFYGSADTRSNVESQAGTTLNYERISIGYAVYTKTSKQTKYTSWQQAGAYAAAYVSLSNPAAPRDGVVVRGMPVPAIDDQFDTSEINSLLNNGVAPLTKSKGKNEVVIRRAVSTYTTNASGIKDDTLLDLTTIDALDRVADEVNFSQANKFQNRVINDELLAQIRTDAINKCKDLEAQEITRNVADVEEFFLAEEDLNTLGQVNTQIPATIVPGLHVIANKIDLIFQI